MTCGNTLPIDQDPEMVAAAATNRSLPIVAEVFDEPKFVPPIRLPFDRRVMLQTKNAFLTLRKAGFLSFAAYTVAVPSAWLLIRSWRAWSFVKAVLGPRISHSGEQYAARMSDCADCDAVIHDGPKMFCGVCNCGRHRWAELRRRNAMSCANCPKGTHAGSMSEVSLVKNKHSGSYTYSCPTCG